jgi:hypothetical protein
MERRTILSNLGFWRNLEGRCLENNRRFRRVSARGIRGHVVTDLDPALLTELLHDPDALFSRPGVRLLKDSRSATVAELLLPVNGVPRPVIYKRFRVRSWQDSWLSLLRPTAAVRSWVNGHALRLRWLPTPRPLAVLQRKRHGLCCTGYLLSAKVADAEDLHDFIKRMNTLPQQKRRAELLPVLEQVARLVRDLHERRVSHRDLKAPNILVLRRESAGGQEASAEPLDHWPLTDSRVWLIDLVGVRRHRRLGQRRRVQNLARLNASFVNQPAVSRTDRLRFLFLYLRSGLRDRGGWKEWWRRIERATRAKVARNLRSGRPLA